MRDGKIFQMHAANAKRNALILGQFELMITWQEALEYVLKASSLRARLRWLIWPADFIKTVHAVQLQRLNQLQQQREAAAAKPHIKKAPAGLVVPHG